MKLSLGIFAAVWPLTAGFFHKTPHHWPASPRQTLQHSDRLTWSEYDHEYIDPLVDHAEIGDMEHVECSADEEDDCWWLENYFEDAVDIDALSNSKGDISNEFWKQKHADDQKKLHHLDDKNAGTAKAQVNTKDISKKDTWSHYEHEYIDELHKPVKTAVKSVRDPMDAKKRAVADEYWAQKSRDEKEKMAKMSGMDLLP
mmetsp:Transcript_3658/g.6363  ORF Transcript_3658/g.6363 Transcript_3658/m.6363 type:complete len:200 (-) Transcript_3658:167-766(-)